jgi:hypothetical protein
MFLCPLGYEDSYSWFGLMRNELETRNEDNER